MGRRRWLVVAVVLVLLGTLVVVLGGWLVGPGTGSGAPEAGPAPVRAADGGTCRVVSPEVPGAGSGLPVWPLCALPAEAPGVVAAIQRGGPFPQAEDGSSFRNAERLLPTRPAGYYRENTVPTPGQADRGARRLVAGGGGEFYYTADHYQSFVVVDVAAQPAASGS